jgi:hypothetical protein
MICFDILAGFLKRVLDGCSTSGMATVASVDSRLHALVSQHFFPHSKTVTVTFNSKIYWQFRVVFGESNFDGVTNSIGSQSQIRSTNFSQISRTSSAPARDAISWSLSARQVALTGPAARCAS